MNKILLIIIAAMLIVSCDGNKIYDTYQTVENNRWAANDSIVFEVNLKEVSKPLHVFLNMRTDANFPYRNLYVISKMTLPNGVTIKDTLEYEMADAYGKWLGEGLTDVKNNKLFFLENYKFPQEGTYQFEFTQAMRKRGELQGLTELIGVRDVGLRIEKSQN
ncbi:gliding motility lipoprotein GldH [Wenyingzhuangia sp. 2_MG-2023]|uniref:gliding motility lipoprotein GldH n=1 Tax=Wenyingzhuangia sp. 2_MG-2023 TaxID=3062639 RepID=UPI0026E285CF|nr:gliding motility lipoprotein GldH [Wenyingzhuangia sp. 2_MG-2023]MDO6736722.1 gliding motility lipoprotein GldH [Wenyingzhuangia sp. 2_MG-2023]